MSIKNRPDVKRLSDGSVIWEQKYERFEIKNYIPVNELNGELNNYGFMAPLLVVLEENKLSLEEAEMFAKSTGLADIAAKHDAGVLFVYPTCEGGWENADDKLYIDLIAEVKLSHIYKDGIAEDRSLFTNEFNGYYIRGTKFHTYVYSFGKSADYAAKYLINSIQGEFLWGPGEITPAMVSLENCNIIPNVGRADIPVISISNSDEVNRVLKEAKKSVSNDGRLLIIDKADYKANYKSFVSKYKMWCGDITEEPDFEVMNMTEEAGCVYVQTTPDNFGKYKDEKEHPVGYFAYYNKDIFDNGPAPLVIGFHGAGDSSMFLTYVSGWYQVAHKHNFLFVSFENHQDVPAAEAMQVVEEIKKRYNIDPHRIYAVGFSMGCGKTWDMFEQFPDKFAAIAPASALFPVYSNPFGRPTLGDKLNTTHPLPIFYSGGCKSHVSELPFQSDWAVERLTYATRVNKCIKKWDIAFDKQENWEHPVLGVPGDRVEVVHDDSRNADLIIHYYDSEDGVCRTAFAYLEDQMHEYRPHTAEIAWQFIEKFVLP